MGKAMSIARIKIALSLRGYTTWPSWNGFGVNTDWPDTKHVKQVEFLRRLLEKRLPETWVVHGPVFAAGGVLVMYAWPKNDPRVAKLLNSKGPSPVGQVT